VIESRGIYVVIVHEGPEDQELNVSSALVESGVRKLINAGRHRLVSWTIFVSVIDDVESQFP
jgi:hypothetical protein